jgi:hypothetical protein
MMKRFHWIGAIALVLMMLVLASPTATAGRVGGPMSTVGMAPLGESVYYDMSFTAGDRAVVTVKGNGRSILHVLLYDSDGHIATGVGSFDAKTVTMDVYRTGVFRVEVRNIGLFDTQFKLTTN